MTNPARQNPRLNLPIASLQKMRKEYAAAALGEADVQRDPIRQFKRWFAQAVAASAGGGEPNAMTLATATPDGAPSARIVLLKGFDARGFCFYTNYDSAKARHLAGNPRAALLFFWPELERQVRVEGAVLRLTRAASAAYFHSRPRGSQLGAWASAQSAVIPGRAVLEKRLRQVEALYAGKEIPLPPFWGGYRLAPVSIEFWQGRPNRLHDRLRYRRGAAAQWVIERLSP